jgi:hypothetical protein
MDPCIVQRESNVVHNGTNQQITAHAHHSDESKDQPYWPPTRPVMKKV